MIIYKNKKNYETFSDNTIEQLNINDDVYFISDGSELYNKIKENSPYFEFVLNENGDLVDITPTEKPPAPIEQPTELEQLKIQLDATNEALDFLIMNGGL